MQAKPSHQQPTHIHIIHHDIELINSLHTNWPYKAFNGALRAPSFGKCLKTTDEFSGKKPGETPALIDVPKTHDGDQYSRYHRTTRHRQHQEKQCCLMYGNF